MRLAATLLQLLAALGEGRSGSLVERIDVGVEVLDLGPEGRSLELGWHTGTGRACPAHPVAQATRSRSTFFASPSSAAGWSGPSRRATSLRSGVNR